MDRNPNPFGDRKLIVSIGVVVVFMIAWQFFLDWKYPERNKKPAPPPVTATAPTTDETTPAVQGSSEIAQPSAPIAPPKSEQVLSFDGEKVSFSVSSRGMGLKDFRLKRYKNAEGESIRVGPDDGGLLFELMLADQANAIDFAIKKTGEGVFEGEAAVGSVQISRRLEFHPSTSSFSSTIAIKGNGQVPALKINIPDSIRKPASSSWLFPSYDHQDFYVGHTGTTESTNYDRAEADLKKEYRNGLFVSLGSQYFSSALMDRSDVAPDIGTAVSIADRRAVASVIYPASGAVQDRTYEQILYVGPKSYDALEKIDPNMTKIIDFGYLAFISKPLLWTMKMFHSLVGNWGVAIILLTLLVRLIVLPFNLMSARSMKAMQRIQPMIAKLREKYKDDPMAQQREMMALMKEHKANPLGGCLPMLLQIPIFFALFSVIGSSVELYQSPFAFWITDLSKHDPLYVLPIIMGITMFLQSKLTPTAMDPTQAKIMMYLPLIFTVFMLQLPSGLTLYMVVSGIFGIVQQWYILRDNKALVPTQST